MTLESGFQVDPTFPYIFFFVLLLFPTFFLKILSLPFSPRSGPYLVDPTFPYIFFFCAPTFPYFFSENTILAF